MTEGGDWTGVPAWGVWRESEDGKLWAPSPTPAFSGTWLRPGLHIWQQKLEPQACHLHKTTALSPKHFPICLLPAPRREDGWGRVINPDLQMEKQQLKSGIWEQDSGSRSWCRFEGGSKGDFQGKGQAQKRGLTSFPHTLPTKQGTGPQQPACSPPSQDDINNKDVS